MIYREITLDQATENIASIIPKLDTLLVLGKGIGTDGGLTPDSKYRTDVAASIIRECTPTQVIFTGGHSWQQELAGDKTPSEGSTMLEYAKTLIDSGEHANTSKLSFENSSFSTVENFVNVKPLLPKEGDDAIIGVMSNTLHFSRGRIRYLIETVYPNAREIVGIILPEINELRQAQIKEERMINLATHTVMLGVKKGDSKAIMCRQHILEVINRSVRRLFSPR